MATPEIGLRIEGRSYQGWKSVNVTRDIEAISGAFQLSVSDRWSLDTRPWPIHEGAACSVTIGDETLITGYVDRRTINLSASVHSLEVAGRDCVGDLIDCSPPVDAWAFNSSIKDFVTMLAQQFGIPVRVAPGLVLSESPQAISIDPGDTAFDVIDRLARQAAFLPVSDGRGWLVLTRAGAERAPADVVEGENILEMSATFDASDRFSRYVVSAEDWFGNNPVGIKSEAFDDGVTRARGLLVLPDQSMTLEGTQRLAEWEAVTRAARCVSVDVAVQGWMAAPGAVWPVNAMTHLRAPSIGIDGEMLISRAVFARDETGTRTILRLVRADAFTPRPTLEREPWAAALEDAEDE